MEQSHKQTASRSAAQKPSSARARRKRAGNTLPFGLKLLVIMFLLFSAMVVGAIVGYSVVGKGAVGDVFNPATWKHIYDLVFAKGS